PWQRQPGDGRTSPNPLPPPGQSWLLWVAPGTPPCFPDGIPPFSSQPFGEWCQLQPKDAAKMPESAWKLFFYSLSWSYGAYLLFCTDYPFFHDPPSVFYGEDTPKFPLLIPFFVLLWLQKRHPGVSGCSFPSVTWWLLEGLRESGTHEINWQGAADSITWELSLEFCSPSRGCDHPGGAALPEMGWGQQGKVPPQPGAVPEGPCPPCPPVPQYIVLFVAKVLLGQMQEVNDVREYDVVESRKAGKEAGIPLPQNGLVKDKRL
uniref:Uncharacterized protein n=1 Tax=Serinus canaria TaxID=9135 RepID=A0A8C9NCH8_SERCA